MTDEDTEKEEIELFRQEVDNKFKEEILEICREDGEEKKDDGDGDLKSLDDFSSTEQGTALVKWYCKNMGEISDDDIDQAISVGGPRDKGADFFHIEKKDDIIEISWGQGKFLKDFTKPPDSSEIEKFFQTIEILEGRKKCSNPNSVLKKNISKYQKTIEKEDVTIKRKMIFFSTGRKPSDGNADGDAWNAGIKKYTDPKMDAEQKSTNSDYVDKLEIEFVDIEKLLEEIRVDRTTQFNLEFSFAHEKEDDVSHKKSIIGFISADKIIEKTQTYKQTIFNLNPRLELGKKSLTFTPIIETLNSDENSEPKEQWKRFWKWNNGLTAVCEKVGKVSENVYEIKNMKIVNGRQTTFAFEKYEDQGRLEDVEVTIFLHEVEGKVSDSEGTKISKATNTQNPIDVQETISGSSIMKRLEKECLVNYDNDFYFERQRIKFTDLKKERKKKLAQKRRFMQLEPTWRAFIAFNEEAHAALESKVKAWGKNGDGFLEKYLKKTFEEVLIPYIFSRLAYEYQQELKKSGKTETDADYRDYQIFRKQVIKNNLLRIISKALNSLSKTEKQEIENEIIKDFRNLTSKSDISEKYFNVIKITFEKFMERFDKNWKTSWPEDVVLDYRKNVNTLDKNPDISNKRKDGRWGLNADQIMRQLKFGDGAAIEAEINADIESDRTDGDDPIGDSLKAIIASESKDGENGTDKDESESDAKDGENGTDKDESESDAKEEHT